MDEGLRLVNTVDNTQLERAFDKVRENIINSADTAQQEGKRIDDAFNRVSRTAVATGDSLKKSLYDSIKVENELTAKIIEQKEVVRNTQADVKRLGEEYRKALRSGNYAQEGKLAQEFNAAKKALEEEKTALFNLNQEKSKAALRTKELKAQMELAKKSINDSTLSTNMLTKAFIALGGTMMLKKFVSQVVSIRGEFQQLEVAFKTMLGNAEKANSLMSQLVDTAAKTPFDLKGVTDGAKQLLAYGVAAEDVNDTLVHLGDIAAGLSLPLGDLVYLYGTTITQGRMYTMDLRQFMGRGIPLAEELAKQFGVTKDKVQELVSTGKVGAEEFKKAIMSMSSEGGKFGGLMEAQSKTITGQISNIEDAIDVMFNNIGKQSEGIINKSLSAISKLVENYEEVGKVLLSVITIYGIYKAACMTAIALTKLQAMGIGALTVAERIHYGSIVLVQKAQALLNKTMLSNPYVLAATALATLVVVMARATNEQRQLQKATERYNEAKEKVLEKEKEHTEKIRNLTDIVEDDNQTAEERIKAIVRLEQEYPSIFAKYDTEAEKLAHIRDIKKEIAEFDKERSLENLLNELAQVEQRIAELEAKGEASYITSMAQSGLTITSQVGGRTARDEAELKKLRNRRAELNGTVARNSADAYLKDLTGVSNKQLEMEIQERKNLISLMTSGQSSVVTYGGAQGTFTRDELIGQMQIMQAELNRRNGASNGYTPAQVKEMLRKQLADAQKALDDFDKSSTQMTIAEAEKKRKELQDAVSAAEKAYKAAGGDTSKNTESKEKEYQNKLKDFAQEERKLKQDLSQSLIDIEKNTSAQEIAQMKHDHEVEMAEFEVRKQDYIRKKIELEQAKAKAEGKTYTTPANMEDVLSKEEKQTFDDMQANIIQKQADEISDYYRTATSAMNDYLRDYGNYQEKRLAITQEYEEKIRKARTEGEKKSLKAEMDKLLAQNAYNQSRVEYMTEYGSAYQKKNAIRERYNAQIEAETDEWAKRSLANRRDKELYSVDLNALKKDIDWASSLDEFGSAFKDITTQIYDKAFSYSRTDEFKGLPAEEQQAFLDMLDQMKSNIKYSFSDLNFVEIGKSINSFREKTEKAKKAVEEREQAEISHANILRMLDVQSSDELQIRITDMQNERDELSKKKNLTDDEQKNLDNLNRQILTSGVGMRLLTDSERKLQEATDNATNAQNEANAQGNDVDDKLSKATSAIENFASGLKTILSADSLSDLWSGLTTIFKNLGGKFQGVIGAVLSLVDAVAGDKINETLNEKLTNFEKLRDATSRYISALETSISLMQKKANMDTGAQKAEDYRAMINSKRTQRLSYIQTASSGFNVDRNSGFWGWLKTGFNGSDTLTKDVMSDLGYNGIDQLRAFVGKSHRSSYDELDVSSTLTALYSLNKDRLEEFMRDYSSLFGQLPSEVQNDLRTIHGYLEEEAAYIAQLREDLLHMSFDDMYSSFMNTMMDIDSAAEDTASDIHKYFYEAMMQEQFQEKYKSQLLDLYNEMGDIMGENISDEEFERKAEEYQKRYQNIVSAGIKERERIQKLTGYYGEEDSYTQKSSVKGFNTMNQETGSELNGRFTSLQISGEQLKTLAETRNEILARMESKSGEIKTLVSAITDALAISNLHLADIVKYTKNLIGLGEKLDNIYDKLQYA